MKRLTLILALTAAPAQMWGQPATTTALPNDPVKFAELDGSVIEASIVRDQISRREGKTFPVRAHTIIKLVIGPNGRIQYSTTGTADTSRGRRLAPLRTGPFWLEKKQTLGSLGGGEGVFLFNDGVLTFIRTFKSGAFKRDIAFSRTADGLSCAAEENFAREEGEGDLAMNSPIDDVPVIVVSSKQISSTCRVVKQGQTPTAGEAAAAPDNRINPPLPEQSRARHSQ